MNTVMVGTVALFAGLGIGIGVTTVVRMPQVDIKGEVSTALMQYEQQRRHLDAIEADDARERDRLESERIIGEAFKGWGDYNGRTGK